MPAARYWRLVAIEAHGGADLEMSALHLYDAAGRADGTATLTSTIDPTAGTLAALQDEDLASTCRFAAAAVRASGFAIVWDLGAGITADIIGPRLAGPTLATFLASCTLQRSDDGAVWQWVTDFARFDWPGAAAYTNVPVAVGDPHFDKVSLLLHMDGADGSTTIVDSSQSSTTIAINGAAKISTAQSEFGGASAEILSSPTSWIDASNSNLNFGTGDYTIEGWYRPDSASNRACFSFGSRLVYVATNDWAYFNGGNSITGGVATANVWYHVALCRAAGSTRLFIDGQQVGGTYSGEGSTAIDPGAIRLGFYNSGNPAGGFYDEFRVTKGLARYTANFTPPTAPFPDSLGGAGGAGGPVFLPPLLRPSTGVPPILLSGGSAGDTVMTLPPATIHLDRQDANGTETNAPATRYRIPGPRWVKEKTASTNVPLRRRVQLYNQRDSRLVREVWSDPVTGEYSFDNIRGDTTYFVIAFDHTGHYRAVIADNLTPEPIP